MKPIAYDAYQEIAEHYAAGTDTKPHNAYYERPGHPAFDAEYYNTTKYLAIEQVKCIWKGFGRKVVMPSFRRSLQELLMPAIGAGFRIQCVVEPLPTEEFRKADPVRFATLSRRPGFLCVQVAKLWPPIPIPDRRIHSLRSLAFSIGQDENHEQLLTCSIGGSQNKGTNMLCRTGVVALFFALGTGVTFSQTSDSKQAPASVAEAVQAIDLSTFPMIDVVGEPMTRTIATQAYNAKGSVESVAKKVQKSLVESGFRPHESSMITPAYAALVMEKSNFKLAVTCLPGTEPDLVSVTLSNLSNVDLAALALPEGWSVIYAGPASAIYSSTMSPEKAKSACRQSLEKAGWHWFGDTSATFFMRQNAVRLQIMVSESPGQPGKSMIQLSTEQLSSEIPYPREFVEIQFSDATGGMVIDSKLSMEEFVAAIRKAMTSGNWKATTEAPIKIDFHDHLIFRGPKNELADCQLLEFENLRRCIVDYRTESQLKEEEARELQRAQELLMQREHDAKISILELPSLEGAKVTELKPNRTEFALKTKTARRTVLAWFEKLEAKGWKRTTTLDSDEVGQYTLSHNKSQIDVSFTDPGFISGEVVVSTDSKTQIKFLPQEITGK